MYVPIPELTRTHRATLDTVHQLSHLYLDAGDRLMKLVITNGKHQITHQARYLAPSAEDRDARPHEWLVEIRHQLLNLIEESWHIVAETHHGAVRAADAQREAMEHLMISTLERGEQSVPVEWLFAFQHFKQSIWQTEAALDSLDDATLTAEKVIGRQLDGVLDATLPQPVAKPKRRRG
jgi:hypothetical protein